MAETQSEIFEQPQTDLPEIYNLYKSGESSEKLVAQMYKDYFSNRDVEAVLLGILLLKKGGHEGLAYLRVVASGSDELGLKVKKVLDQDMNDKEIEQEFGLSRIKIFGEVFEEDFYIRLWINLVRRGIFKGSFEDFVLKSTEECRQVSENKGSGRQESPFFNGKVEQCISNLHCVFGTTEPFYFEALGPLKILELRSCPEPKMLLLGSLGVYSARDFSTFCRKINQNSARFVIDIDPYIVGILNNDVDQTGNRSLQMSATELNFSEDSFDVIFASQLTDKVVDEYGFLIPPEKSIRSILLQSFRVLKKGGLCVFAEAVPDENSQQREMFFDNIRSTARAIGFSDVRIVKKSGFYYTRADNNTATVDQNGFPQYKDGSIILESNEENYGLVAVK